MPHPHRSGHRAARSARALVALATVLLSSLAPAAVVAGPTIRPTAPAGAPSVHYEDAQTHAADRIDFEPGARASIPFRPRPGDPWTVDGRAPRALPAGRLSGGEMRAPGSSDGPAVQRPPRIDLPTVAPRSMVTADAAADRPATDGPFFEPTAAVDPGALRREVFGFLPYWELTDSSTRLDWEKLSTVAYFGVGADGTGALMKRNADGSTTVGWSGWTSSKMTSVLDAAHKSHARVVLTVQSFAWSSTGLKRQKALLGSAGARSRLAHQIAAAVRDRGADGVNLDFEPIASGYADEFTALVRKVRTVLDHTADGYQLTFDATGWIGNYPIEDATASGGADAVFIMGYDYRSSGSKAVGSIAPVGGPAYDVADTLRAYLDRVSPSKLILGVPYYGRAWSTSSDDLRATNISGTKYGASASVTYATARAYAKDHGKRYDTSEGVAWTAYKRKNCTATYGCVNPWRQLYYDDAKAIKAKYDLVNHYDLRGAGIWALGYDGTRTELYQAIKDKFITDTVPPTITAGSLTRSTFSPDGDGRADSTTATLSVTGLVTWGYTVRRVDGTNVGDAVRSGTVAGKHPTFTWDGTDGHGDAVEDGTYRLTLWAADVSDNRAQRQFTVVLDTTPALLTQITGRGYLSPDADHHQDTLAMSWAANEALTGAVRLRDEAGATVRSWSFAKRAGWLTTWTGRDRHGALVRDGRYTLRVDGRDAAGNRTVAERVVLVDRTIRSVAWSDRSFDPAARESSRAQIDLRRAARLTVAIYRGDTLIRKVWTDKPMAAGWHHWTWDGRTPAGRFASPGTYTIVVVATSRYGTTRFSRTVTVEVH